MQVSRILHFAGDGPPNGRDWGAYIVLAIMIMKAPVVLAVIVGSFLVSGFMIGTDKPRAPLNGWAYDVHQYKADSSGWSNYNKRQIDFYRRDSSGRIKPSIGFSFNKWPVTSGIYKITSYTTADDEVTVLAGDQDFHYISKTRGTAVAHVTVVKGKVSVWGNGVVMQALTRTRLAGEGDSVVMDFNVGE